MAIAILIFVFFHTITFEIPYQYRSTTFLSLALLVLLPITGIHLLIGSLKKIKLLRGDFIRFNNKVFHVKSRGVEKKINNLKEVSSIRINIYFIIIDYSNNSSIKIYLEDYNEMTIQRKIKQNFEKLKTETINNN